MTTVAVVGASGFVGATFVERLLAGGRHEVRPFIHASGNAWRLARHGLALRSVDLLREADVRAAVEGADYVVNCSRGSDAVMFRGLEHLLKACQAARVRRFVHLSSVAVYGEPPPPESVREEATPRAVRGTYGGMKLRQDDMVRAAARRGLPAVVLCPPNISGPYSGYLLGLIEAIRTGRMALVDHGHTPCNLVDVENLAAAIERALTCQEADGTRIFVTDDADTSWRDLAEALVPFAGTSAPLPSLTRDEARRRVAAGAPRRVSLVGTVKHLISADVRSVLRQDPLIARVDGVVRGAASLVLSERSEGDVRRWLSGPTQVARPRREPDYDERFVLQQLRGVRHGAARARAVLGYAPERDFAASMRAFRAWYELYVDPGDEAGRLLREL